MSKQVQISYELFMDLCRYHLSGVDDEALIRRIHIGLQDKMGRAAAREMYTAQKCAQKLPRDNET